MSAQTLLSSRLPFLERGVGHQTLMKWHKYSGIGVITFAMFHPLLVLSPYFALGFSVLDLYKIYTIYHYLGYFTLFLLLFIVITAIFTSKLKINYEHWKWIHKLVYVALIGGYLHSFKLGSDIYLYSPLFYWWLFILSLTIFCVSYRYIFKKLLKVRYKFEITDVVREANDIFTIKLAPKNKMLHYYPGQFAFTNIHSKNIPDEEHHFTISSSPSEPYLSFTIKSLGDYTAKIRNLKKGDEVEVEGPFGTLTNAYMKGPFLFIAGGIGITPIRSMLIDMQANSKNEKSILLYSNKVSEDVAFKKQFDSLMNESDWFSAYYYLTGEDKRGFINKRIDKKVLEQVLKEFKKQPKVFIVGPTGFINQIKADLKKLGLPQKNIFTEKFSLK